MKFEPKNFVITLSLLMFLIFPTEIYSQAQKKNVLFIITDDLNCNIGDYGHYLVKTPNIDKLADQGLKFENAFCNFPLCGPSRASMMTGLYPDQTGHHRLRDLIRDHVPGVVTLSQNFMQNGYQVDRVGKIYHYDNPNGIGTPGHDDSLSWQRRFYPRGIDKDLEPQINTLVPGRFGATLSWLAAPGKDEEHTDGMVATQAVKLLEEYAGSGNPFFLAVGFYKPHTPYVAPKKYFDLYKKEDIRIPRVPKDYFESLPVPAVKSLTVFKDQVNLDDSIALSAIQAYYATISFLDAQVGRVMDALEKQGLAENTIIIFTSDHGYHMGEHGYYQKQTLFEDAGRIPLIVYDPSMRTKGKSTNSIVEMIDLYPTLSDLVGISKPEYLAGVSFKEILDNPKIATRESALTQISGGYTIRTKDARYTRWGKGGNDMVELYDRKSDPKELVNLAKNSKYTKKINIMDEMLEKRINEASKAPVGLKVIK